VKGHSPLPGTIIAIPIRRPLLGWCFAVLIERNRFGSALGLIKLVAPEPKLPEECVGAVLRRPIFYTELKPRRDGWRLLEGRPELVSLFDGPEIYHAKSAHMNNPAVGEVGSAEMPSGAMRPISRTEAKEVGLDGEYRQVRLAEELVYYLEKHARLDNWPLTAKS